MDTATCHGFFSLLLLCHAVTYLFAATFDRAGLQLDYATLFLLLWANAVISFNPPDCLGCGVMRLISRLWIDILLLNPGRRVRNLTIEINSFAFGGRGYFASVSGRRRGRVFDSTLGFPGEGPGKSLETRRITHEVANCLPTVKTIPDWTQWEPCWIVGDVSDCYDVQIVGDNDIVKNVPKRFVREIKVSTSKLWPLLKVFHLRKVMNQTRAQILEGTHLNGNSVYQ